MGLEDLLRQIGFGVLAIALVSVLYALGLALYNVLFHPLANVPGPVTQKLSGLPRLWHCYQGDRYLREAESHNKFGSVIRIAPNALSFNTPSAFQAIHGKGVNVFKGDEFYGVLDGGPHGAKSIQMTADNEEHAARRRVLNRAIPARVTLFSMINGLANLLIQTVESSSAVEKSWSKPVDVNLLARWYSFDIISKISFGQSLDLLKTEQFRWLPMCLEKTSIFVYWMGFEPHVKFWRWFLGSNWPSRLGVGDAVEAQRYAAFVSDLVMKRKARMADVEKGADERSSDVFEHLFRANQFSDADLQADSSLLVAAGSDAVRLTFAALIFYLLKNPHAMEKVTEEIRTAVASTEEISDAGLSKLKYLRACVDETLRRTPPKPASIPREVGKGGIEIDGIYVPQGATVGVSVYSLHHDADIFPDPFAFKPERWLDSDDRRMQAAFVPFYKGPRMCPGVTTAYFAIQLAVFHLLYRYDIRPASGVPMNRGISGLTRLRHNQDEYQMNDWIIGFANGPVVEIQPRT